MSQAAHTSSMTLPCSTLPLRRTSSPILAKSRETSLPLSLNHLEKSECALTSTSDPIAYLPPAALCGYTMGVPQVRPIMDLWVLECLSISSAEEVTGTCIEVFNL